MKKLFVSLIVIIAGISQIAVAADHNAGLKVTGNVFAWSPTDEDFYRGATTTPVTKIYTAQIEFTVANDGTEKIIVPGLKAWASEVRFGESSDGENADLVKTLKSFKFVSGSRSPEPDSDGWRILEPGESYRFGYTIRVKVDPGEKYSLRNPWIGEFVETAANVRELLSRPRLKFVFRIVPDEKDPDALRTLAAKWKQRGIFPLNESGEFFIETPVFDSNTYWIKAEQLP